MSNPLLDSANKYRSVILWAEIAGWLHDIGKFSSDFIKYRANWHEQVKAKDPHTHKIMENAFNALPLLNQKLSKLAALPDGLVDCTLQDLIWEHIKSENDNCPRKTLANAEWPTSQLCQVLYLSDSADTAEDRNNPLYSGEQRGDSAKYKSTVFGYETPLEYQDFDNKREALIEELSNLLPDYFEVLKTNADYDLITSLRGKISEPLSNNFKDAVSDTVRPANDISLWQHSYSTATIFKAQIAARFYSLIAKLPEDLSNVKFDLLGIGWDGLNFLSQGHKLGDLAARESLIKDMKKKLRRIIEVKYAIGNSVYDDVDCICFLIAAGSGDNQNLINEIAEIVNELSDGEISPQFALKESSKSLGEIVNVIRALREKEPNSKLVSDESIKQPQPSIEVTPKWSKRWKNDGKQSVCPVCQKRPYNDRVKTVCEICQTRRIEIAKESRDNNNLQTRFVGEIADANGRVALLALRFGLDEWTSGNMIRTLMVKGASAFDKEINDLGNIKDFEEADEERELLKTEVPYNWGKIKNDIDNFDIAPGDHKDRFFLYGYPDRYKKPSKIKSDDIKSYLNQIKEQAKNEFDSINDINIIIVNMILGKWPTPGRLLQTWENTRAFISSVTDEYLSKKEIESQNINGTRLKLLGNWSSQVDNVAPLRPRPYAAYEAYLDDESINNASRKFNVFFINGNDGNYVCHVIDDQNSRLLRDSGKFKEGVRLNILANENEKKINNNEAIGSFTIENVKEEEYNKWRLITKTPTTALMLVPAKTALALIAKLNEKYDEELGKVRGRLPLSAGLIFFKAHTPMFAVLDAGRRMIKYFDDKMKFQLDNKGTKATIKVADDKTNIEFNKRPIVWEIARQLADGTSDFYHPRLLLAKEQKLRDLENYKDFVKTSMGSSLSALDFNEDKDIELSLNILPNYFAYDVLDSASRRLKVGIDKKQSDELFQELTIKPYWLDEIKRFIEIWDALKDGDLTNTQLRNFESLMIGKYKQWYVEDSDNNLFENEWVKLCDSLQISDDFRTKFLKNEHLKSYNYKLMVDVMQINLHILKNKQENEIDKFRKEEK